MSTGFAECVSLSLSLSLSIYIYIYTPWTELNWIQQPTSQTTAVRGEAMLANYHCMDVARRGVWDAQAELVQATNRSSEHSGRLVVAVAQVQIHQVEHDVLGSGDRNCGRWTEPGVEPYFRLLLGCSRIPMDLWEYLLQQISISCSLFASAERG